MFDPEELPKNPLLALLFQKGDVSELERYNSSFFARYEKVLKDCESSSAPGDALIAEREMLRQVLDWILQHQKEEDERE